MILRSLPLPRQVKVEVLKRVVAKFIDFAVMSIIALILPYPLGPIAGFLYSILGDGIHWKGLQGQSVGKKLLGLRVVSMHDHRPIDLKTSALRNAPVGLATFFAIIPIWGWAILIIVGLPMMMIEILLMLREEHGHRVGDALADTEVVADGDNILVMLYKRLRSRFRGRA